MTTDLSLPRVARDVLRDLHGRFGLDCWVLTRVVVDQAMVIFSVGDGSMPEGTAVPLSNSLEARLLEGGPRSASNLSSSFYSGVTLPFPDASAFAGIPVHTVDGQHFGSLYGVGRQAVTLDDRSVEAALSLAERIIRLVLAMEETGLSIHPSSNRGDSRRDPVTGLLNASGWDEALAIEAARCGRYGNRGAIVRLVVEGRVGPDDEPAPVDDVALRQTGEALRTWRRGADVVARTGGRTFSVLLVEAWELDAVDAISRLRQILWSRRISVRIGMADNRARSLVEAVDVAQKLAEDASPS